MDNILNLINSLPKWLENQVAPPVQAQSTPPLNDATNFQQVPLSQNEQLMMQQPGFNWEVFTPGRRLAKVPPNNSGVAYVPASYNDKELAALKSHSWSPNDLPQTQQQSQSAWDTVYNSANRYNSQAYGNAFSPLWGGNWQPVSYPTKPQDNRQYYTIPWGPGQSFTGFDADFRPVGRDVDVPVKAYYP